MSRKYLELFRQGFDSTVEEKRKIENWPFVGHDSVTGKVVYTEIPTPVEGPPDNEVWYTSSNGNVINPSRTDTFGANIVSNTYENDKGVIKFNDSVESIGYRSFANSRYLTSIVIPNSVTSIGKEAFQYCGGITSIVIPNSVTVIDPYAFVSCGITSIVIPDSVTRVNESAFGSCNYLTSVTIGNSVEWIKESTFSWCQSLTSINIPNSVRGIEQSAFYKCSSLTSITIPNSVTEIGGQAFRDCISLASIVFEGTMEEWSVISKVYAWNYGVPATYVQCSDGQVAL